MTVLDEAWPPRPMATDRLVLRAPEADDRPFVVDLLSSAEVHTYLGGARPREEVERETADIPEVWPGGTLVVERDGADVGVVLLRHLAEHRRAAAVGRVELGYLFLPTAWGQGFATEACGAALEWLDRDAPDEQLVLITQSANVASMRLAAGLGFVEAERFEAWGAEQWLGVRTPPPSD